MEGKRISSLGPRPHMRQRTKKLIKRSLQLKMVAVFVGMACISGCFQVILVNRSVIELMSTAEGGQLSLVDQLPGVLAENLLWTIALLVPLMGYVGLVVTQRVAGPIYVFERYLDRLLAGERMGPCRLRKADELKDLAERLTRVAERLGALDEGERLAATEASADASGDAAPGPRPDTDTLDRAA